MPTRLSLELIRELRQNYPRLRDDYFGYLQFVGWGDTETGHMIYEGPTGTDEIYGSRDDHSNIVLLGDDLQGYCFGYDTETKCYGEIGDVGTWKPWPSVEGIERYVTESEDDAT